MDIHDLYREVMGYLHDLDVHNDGEHVWSNYENATAISVRLTEIRNEIAFLELVGKATPEAKKFRTTILDPTIERFQEIARFESRKITGKAIESQMER